MKHPGPDLPGTPLRVRSLHRLLIAGLLASVFILSSCSVPFTGDDDEDTSAPPTPVATQGEVPRPSPTATPVPTVVDEQGWTVITGPEKQDPPDSRGEEQVLRLTGSADGPSTIDPALVRDTQSAFFARQVFRGLVRLDSDLRPVPDLAERIEISPDGMHYLFILHDGITFHDGSPIQAADVKSSLERASDPALTGGDGLSLPVRNHLEDIEGARERMDGMRDDIPGIQVIDERSLQVDLVRGVADFLERLSNPTTYVVDVSDAGRGDDWWESPNGSGPFAVLEWNSDAVIRLTAHDGYVRPPALREVSIRVGREAVGEVRLYETGEIDVATVPISVVDRFDYQGSPHDGEMRVEPMLSTTFVMINPNSEPFRDERMRQALMHAFPRNQIADVMLDGRARHSMGVLPPEMGPAGDIEFPYEFDDELAASLLSELGAATLEDRVTIYTSGGGIPAALKSYYDLHFTFQVEVVQLRWSDYLNDLERGELPFFVLSWVADGPDDVAFLRSLFHSESPENYIDFADPEVDRLLDEAVVERDDARRTDLTLEAHQRILDHAVVMPLFHGVDHILVGRHVNGLESTPMGILGLETVWIER